MKHLTLCLVMTACLSCLPFVADAQTATCIVVERNASAATLHAAHELQRLLQQGGIDLPVERQRLRRHRGPRKGCLYVGHTPWTERMLATVDKNDSYVIAGDGRWMLLDGKGKGTLYAVYDYLERYCHYRLYTPDNLIVTHLEHLPWICDTLVEQPAFDYREVYYRYPNESPFYADWHRLHTAQDRSNDWGLFVHTFQDLIPASHDFDRHSEWFSERDGQRVRDGQLCLSNDEMRDTLCARLAARIAADSGHHRIWSVSNNDNYNACQCAECLRMDSLYGGPTGTLLHFINQVARQFPNQTISTLAYQYTRSAPEGLRERPDSNVNIMFCSIECGREEAIDTHPKEAAFRNDMENWNRLTDNIFMWDYVVQFRNYWNPFPNLHVLQPNLQYFRDHGVKMIFEQGSGKTVPTSWMELRTYMIAKLLWNPDLNADSIINDFCHGYYGAAAPYVRAVIDTMTATLRSSGQRLDIYGFPVDGADGYLRSDRIDYYYNMMQHAYDAVPGDALIHNRLRYFELALDYAAMELYSHGRYPIADPEELLRRVDRFVADCRRYGIGQLMEHGYTPAEFAAVMRRHVEKQHNSARPEVVLRKAATPPYLCQAEALCDGQGGVLDYRHGWVGFFGDTLDAVVTLGDTPQPLQEVSMDYYFYPLSWIFLPKKVEYYISNDSITWRLVGLHRPDNPEILATPQMQTLATTLPQGTTARYLRVVATPLPHIPVWHRATGHPAWLFTDEIVIKQ